MYYRVGRVGVEYGTKRKREKKKKLGYMVDSSWPFDAG